MVFLCALCGELIIILDYMIIIMKSIENNVKGLIDRQGQKKSSLLIMFRQD